MIVIHGHRTLKAPHPVRSAQLTRVPPSQYHGGGPRGNPRCCGFCLFGLFDHSFTCHKILLRAGAHGLFLGTYEIFCFFFLTFQKMYFDTQLDGFLWSFCTLWYGSHFTFFQEMETATVPKPANLALPFLVCSMTQAISSCSNTHLARICKFCPVQNKCIEGCQGDLYPSRIQSLYLCWTCFWQSKAIGLKLQGPWTALVHSLGCWTSPRMRPQRQPWAMAKSGSKFNFTIPPSILKISTF